jgi:O-antigen/teichoic acid export membrane protein
MVTPVKKNTIANLIGSNWPNLLGLVLLPVYIHFLGIEAYGVVGFFWSLQGVFGLLDAGMSATLNREFARYSAQDGRGQDRRDLLRTLEALYWPLSLMGGILLLLLAPTISGHWINPEGLSRTAIENSFYLMGLAIALQMPSSLYQGGLMGLQRQVLLNSVLVVLATFRGLGAALILWKVSPTVEAFFAWHVVVSGVQVITMRLLLWGGLPETGKGPAFRRDLLGEVWRYAAYISGNSIVGVVLTQADKLILIRILSLEHFGYYMLAWSVAASLWAIILPINTALFPQFVQLFERREEFDIVNLFHHASQVISVAIIPIGMLLILFSREILLLWTRNPVIADNAHLLVSLLVLGVTLNGMCSVPSYMSAAFGWPQLVMYVNIGQAIVLFPAIVFAASRYGAVGAAVIWVIMNSTYMFAMMPILFRRYLRNEKWKWYLLDVGRPLTGAVAAGIVMLRLLPHQLSPCVTATYLLSTLALMTAISILLAPTVRTWIGKVVLGLWRHHGSY